MMGCGGEAFFLLYSASFCLQRSCIPGAILVVLFIALFLFIFKMRYCMICKLLVLFVSSCR